MDPFSIIAYPGLKMAKILEKDNQNSKYHNFYFTILVFYSRGLISRPFKLQINNDFEINFQTYLEQIFGLGPLGWVLCQAQFDKITKFFRPFGRTIQEGGIGFLNF